MLLKIATNSKYIQAKRIKLNMNPSDIDKTKLFMKDECDNQMGLTALMKHRIKLQQILSGKVELNQKHVDEYNANYKKNRYVTVQIGLNLVVFNFFFLVTNPLLKMMTAVTKTMKAMNCRTTMTTMK